MKRLSVLCKHLAKGQGSSANQTPHSAASFCSAASSSSSAPVLFENVCGRNYLVTLNKPKALNALNLDMIRLMTKFYGRAREEPCVIVMKGAGGKAFCAGGDVVALYESVKQQRPVNETCEFFAKEYELDLMLAELPSNVHHVCLLNGVTMGGGVGLSVHGRYRVACESTLFAMPETGIGFYTDVGGAYFLPRLKPAGLGEYLALTGHRLRGSDALHAGVATHFVPQSKLDELEQRLLECDSPESVPRVLSEFAIHPSLLPPFSLANNLESIRKHFTMPTVESILESLNNDAESDEFCSKTAATMGRLSPTALKLILKALQYGKDLSLKQVLDMEYGIVRQCMMEHDFVEGVRATLVDKDKNPQWKPDNLAEVTDEMISQYFR